MGIFNKLISSFPKNGIHNSQVSLGLVISLILVTLPLKNIYVSIATIGFVVAGLVMNQRQNIKNEKSIFLPILFFIMLSFSLLWTNDFDASLSGLQKSLSFIVIPVVFFIIPKISKETQNWIFRVYSFGMLVYASMYIIMAGINYYSTLNRELFFNKNLVPEDPGTIYMSVFASFALFYFVQLKSRKNLENVALIVLSTFIFLLSSKSIITIDFVIIIWFYSFYAKISQATKALTISAVSLFLFFSIFFVKEVKERFLIEFETAFVDNIPTKENKELPNKIHNVSVAEAWNTKSFQQTDFFPGTALRVYQLRIFTEMQKEKPTFFTGFGLEASQDQIREKCKIHNLNNEYGEYNFHNQFIQTFAEIGIIGLLILIAMLTVNLFNGIKQKDFLHIAFAITMIMLFLSESFFCRQRGIVFFTLLYCLFNANNHISQRDNIK
ncbi:O-antigen ligase family protein [Flavobacterium sp.]|jgi:O-antigen ligase|uniref:O-antigen ligase family protein n=1 Tax=Flavobacterium sp. TaxID=239 RepID=UPI0037BE83B2